jgi:hypothetical protein
VRDGGAVDELVGGRTFEGFRAGGGGEGRVVCLFVCLCVCVRWGRAVGGWLACAVCGSRVCVRCVGIPKGFAGLLT